MPPTAKRRWFRFSVRTLLVAVALACLAVWICRAMYWIDERRQLTERGSGVMIEGESDAPWPLWLFGAKGVERVTASVHGASLPDANRAAEGRAAELRRIFPEAEIKTLRRWPYMEHGDFVPRGPGIRERQTIQPKDE